MICSKCQNVLKDGETVCSKCGMVVGASTPLGFPCVLCGAPIPVGAEHCPKCGGGIPAPQAAMPSTLAELPVPSDTTEAKGSLELEPFELEPIAIKQPSPPPQIPTRKSVTAAQDFDPLPVLMERDAPADLPPPHVVEGKDTEPVGPAEPPAAHVIPMATPASHAVPSATIASPPSRPVPSVPANGVQVPPASPQMSRPALSPEPAARMPEPTFPMPAGTAPHPQPAPQPRPRPVVPRAVKGGEAPPTIMVGMPEPKKGKVKPGPAPAAGLDEEDGLGPQPEDIVDEETLLRRRMLARVALGLLVVFLCLGLWGYLMLTRPWTKRSAPDQMLPEAASAPANVWPQTPPSVDSAPDAASAPATTASEIAASVQSGSASTESAPKEAQTSDILAPTPAVPEVKPVEARPAAVKPAPQRQTAKPKPVPRRSEEDAYMRQIHRQMDGQ